MSNQRLWLCGLLALVIACSPDAETADEGSSENTPPVANPQTVTATSGKAVEIVLSGSDADGDSLSFKVVDQTKHGQLEGEAPTLVYTSDPDFVGEDAFTFVVNDGTADSKAAIVSILVEKTEVKPTNTLPVANAQTIKTPQDQQVSILLTGSDADGDTLNFEVASQPKHGELKGEAPELTYLPNEGFVGNEGFDFVVNDGKENSEPATISIQVLAEDEEVENTRPIANSQNLEAEQDTSLTITLTGSDAEGDELSRLSMSPKTAS